MDVATRRVTVIGNVNADLIVRPATQLPPPGTELTVEGIEIRTGGAAGITALTMGRLGFPPRLIGCVGDDAFGASINEELRRAGVADGASVVSGARTGISMAFEAPGRDRSFLTFLGGLSTFDASMIPADALDTSLVLFCGYFLLPALRGEPIRRLLEVVRTRGGMTLLDTGWDPAGWPEESRREVRGLLPLVDVFLPNGAETRGLASLGEVTQAARALQQISNGWVVAKLGPDGCAGFGPDGAEYLVPAPPTSVKDTTGAGDAFNAGLLYALSREFEWPEALAMATRVASAVVSRTSDDRYPALAAVLGSTVSPRHSE